MTDASTTAEGQLPDRVDRLTAMVESLQAELAGMRRQPRRAAAAVADHHDHVDAEGSRRHLLKLAGGAAVAAVAGSMLLDGQQPVAADSTQDLVVGRANFAQDITYLRNAAGANGTAITGSALTTERTMFWADNRLSTLAIAVGIRGDGRESGTGLDGYGGTGVRGTGTTDGVAGSGPFGVRGTGAQVGVVGIGSGGGGLGVGASGPRAALLLTSGTGSQPPNRTDAHVAGEIDIDANGDVWLCVAAGSPGQWRKLGGPTTAGAMHAIDPVRVFDSRWTGNTRLTTGASKVVSVADGHDSAGVINAVNSVPVGATAIAYNLTVTETTGAGFLSVTPGSATGFVSSSINWSGDGQNLANGLIVALDGLRQIKVFCGGGGSTHYIVDVTGYFR